MQPAFAELKRHAGFGQPEVDALRALHPLLAPSVPELLESFRTTATLCALTRRLLDSAPEKDRLEDLVGVWLDRLLLGPHDEDYASERRRIGRWLAATGLPGAYLFSTAAQFRSQLLHCVLRATVHHPFLAAEGASAVDQILDLDLALVNEAWRCERNGPVAALVAAAANEARAVLETVAGNAPEAVRRILDDLEAAVAADEEASAGTDVDGRPSPDRPLAPGRADRDGLVRALDRLPSHRLADGPRGLLRLASRPTEANGRWEIDLAVGDGPDLSPPSGT